MRKACETARKKAAKATKQKKGDDDDLMAASLLCWCRGKERGGEVVVESEG